MNYITYEHTGIDIVVVCCKIIITRGFLLFYSCDVHILLPPLGRLFYLAFVSLSVSNFTWKLLSRSSWTLCQRCEDTSSSASGCGCNNFLKDSLILQNRAFFCNLAHISGTKLDGNFTRDVSLDNKVLITFRRSSRSILRVLLV